MPHFTASEKSAEVIASGEKIELDRTLTVLLVGVGGQDYLREGGKMFVNDEVIVPVSVAIGNFEMPEDIEGKLDELGAVRIPAGQIAREVGSPRSTNVVLVGALSTALPFSVEDWEDAISRRVPPKTVEANLKAFRKGRAAAEA